MSEKFCLKWNEFQDNVNGAFASLRDDKEFSNVTLVCEDGKQVEAHKIVLSASSPFFRGILSRNKHPHPLIYMRGMKSGDLMAVIDFLYFGEANVFQDNLDSFFAVAEELKLKGLVGGNGAKKEDEADDKLMTKSTQIPPKMIPKKEKISPNGSETGAQNPPDFETERRIAIPNDLSRNFAELDAKIKSMMEKGSNVISNQRAIICQVCGKEGTFTNIKDHIEANHLEGLILPCSLCEKICKSRNSLRMHKRNNHTTK